jgi:hypothetical protein
MKSGRSARDDGEVYRISGAGRSLSDDVDARTRRYLISMGIRTLCFIGCVFSFVVLKQPVLGWILLIGAAFLPYIAVVVANGGREPARGLPETTLMGDSPPLPGPGTDPSKDD